MPSSRIKVGENDERMRRGDKKADSDANTSCKNCPAESWLKVYKSTKVLDTFPFPDDNDDISLQFSFCSVITNIYILTRSFLRFSCQLLKGK